MEKIPKVRIIRMEKRMGIVGARMKGINAAMSTILIFLDSHVECGNGNYRSLALYSLGILSYVKMAFIASILFPLMSIFLAFSNNMFIHCPLLLYFNYYIVQISNAL